MLMMSRLNRLNMDKERRATEPNEVAKSLYLSGEESERHKYVVHKNKKINTNDSVQIKLHSSKDSKITSSYTSTSTASLTFKNEQVFY